jgi:hypothetical protein
MRKRQKRPDIFDRGERLRAEQLDHVAEQRMSDADCLCKSERANGAMYLAGFVVECCLKAQLLRTHAWLRSASSAEGRGPQDKRLWLLLYSHKLDEILAHLPAVCARLRARDQAGTPGLFQRLKEVCATWTIFARYSPRSARMDEARRFLENVRELKRCLA